MQLRQYQAGLISKARKLVMGGSDGVLIQLGCGGGKSVIAGMMAKMATDMGNNVLFLVHRKELCLQIRHTFELCGVDFGHCTIGMVQTLARRKLNPATDMIIVDECHHVMAKQYQNILKQFPNAVKIGFTATPQRMDGQDLHDVFPEFIEGPATSWLIKNKFLAPYKAYGAVLLNGNYGIARGEYKNADIDDEINEKQHLYGDAVRNWMRIANGQKTIAYCHSIDSATRLADEYRAAGVNAAYLTGKTAKQERMQTVEDFRQGKITVLVNVDLFGEGFDVPDCECVQLLRPTASQTVYVQQVMRAMRYKAGKTATILDHTTNIDRFGLPDCLKVIKYKQPNAEWPKLVLCDHCQHYNARNNLQELRQNLNCDFCGLPLKIKLGTADERDERGEMETVECDLEQLGGIPDMTKVIAWEDVKDWDTLVRYQKQQGYKFGWCFYKAKTLKIKIPARYHGYMWKRGMIG